MRTMTSSRTMLNVLLLTASIASLLFLAFIANSPSLTFLRPAYAENVIFIVPGSSQPASVTDFDPPLQIIAKGESIVFVNPDGVDHHLVVKDDASQEVFDIGVLKQNQFVSQTFSENGEYTIECKLYQHMKGQIRVTDDIATFTKSIPDQNLDIQLSRSPASSGVGVDTYFKVIFIDKETGGNHPHIDYTLTFNDSNESYVHGMGGHTVDGAEYGVFAFDKEDSFTPIVEVSGINFVPINPVAVEFETIVTPEFPAFATGAVMASALGAIALYMRKKFSDNHL